MKQSITLTLGDSVEIHGNGLVLSFVLDNQEGILSQVASEEGGKRILIRQHDGDHRTIVFCKELPS